MLEVIKADLEAEYGLKLHIFSIDKFDFIYRPLTIKELSVAHAGDYDFAELEDKYVSDVTLYPENFDFGKIKAGYITRYADEILKVSGFDDLGTINGMMEAHRA